MWFRKPDFALRRAALVTVLRNRDLWPPGFTWNYCRSDCCAMGLAKAIGHVKTYTSHDMAMFYGFSPCTAHRIFLHAAGIKGFFFRDMITPQIIADMIEAA